MYAEHVAVNNGGEDQEVEDLAACFPHGSIAIFLLALLIEAIHLRDLSRFVVSANQDNPVGVPGIFEPVY